MPLILALSKCGVLAFGFAVLLGRAAGLLHSLTLPLALLALLTTIAAMAHRRQHNGAWERLALMHLLAQETAVIVFGHQAGLHWVLPAFYLMPLATSPAWLTRRDFVIAMSLCAAGPLAALLTANEPAPVVRHAWLGLALYLPICIAAAASSTAICCARWRATSPPRPSWPTAPTPTT